MGIAPDKVRFEILAGVDAEASTRKEPKLSAKTARILELAADESRRMEHDHVGAEHLLLALLRPREAEYMYTRIDEGVTLLLRKLGLVEWEKSLRNWILIEGRGTRNLAFEVLSGCGVDLQVARFAVLESGEGAQDNIWQKAQPIIRRSQHEARLIGCGRINTGHLLLALLHDEQEVIAQLIQSMGIDVSELRAKIKSRLYSDNELMGSKSKFTREAKRVIEEVAAMAQYFGKQQIDDIQLFLALFPDKEKFLVHNWQQALRGIGRLPHKDDIAFQVLAEFGVTVAKIMTFCEQSLSSLNE